MVSPKGCFVYMLYATLLCSTTGLVQLPARGQNDISCSPTDLQHKPFSRTHLVFHQHCCHLHAGSAAQRRSALGGSSRPSWTH